MGDIEYPRFLNNGDQVRYRIKTKRGQVVDFVVQYEAFIDDRLYPVVRYDGSHGQGHRDILNARGETVEKHWLPDHMDFKACLEFADQDLRANWKKYRDQFLERYR